MALLAQQKISVAAAARQRLHDEQFAAEDEGGEDHDVLRPLKRAQ
jgi:hypothetical protein